MSPTLLGDKAGYKGLTPQQNTDLWKRAGTIVDDKLSKLFATEKYQSLKEDEKAKVVEDFIAKAKINARAELILDMIKDIHGEELKKKLSELKKTGLLTKDVFAQLTKLR